MNDEKIVSLLVAIKSELEDINNSLRKSTDNTSDIGYMHKDIEIIKEMLNHKMK